MANLANVLSYLCMHAPKKHTMPITRLMRLAYLADWKAAMDRGATLTNTKWEYGTWGPWSKEISDLIHEGGQFGIEKTTTQYETPKEVVTLRNAFEEPALDLYERTCLDAVLERNNRKFLELARLVFSTFPLLVHQEGEVLDLVSLAERYAKERKGND